MKKNITQVAKELNLSVGTISKIVNNKGNVSAKTRARVLAYVNEIGYVADNSARILKSKKSWTIGVIYSDISLVGFEHPFFSKILQAFKSHVEKEGYDIVLIDSKLGDHQLTYLEWCRNKKVDGILIVMGNINNPNIIEVVNSSYPTVSTDIVMKNLTSIISDDEEGVRLAIQDAYDHGVRSIAMFSGPTSSRSFVQRIEAYKRELSRLNLTVQEDDIWITDGFDDQHGLTATVQWIKQRKQLPELILVTSDVLAFGVVRGLEQLGYCVPKDVNVIGFDDIDFSKYFVPSLSTVQQDTTQIGVEAAKELLKSIKINQKSPEKIIKIPVKLVKRETTCY